MKLVCLVIVIIFLIPFVLAAHADYAQIPSWVKNTARWWSQGQVGDSDFVKGIQYLVEKHMILLPKTDSPESNQTGIPAWVKNNAGWWSNGTIGDSDFIKGLQYLVHAKIIQIAYPRAFIISSPAFENNSMIPIQYTCDGNGTSPPLAISGVPQNAKSLALTVVDVDAPNGPFTHWIMWNIPTNTTEFSGGEPMSFPRGITSAGKDGYEGPCPPSGIHRYFFTLYALDTILDLGPRTTRVDLEQSMATHIINQTVLMGIYSRNWLS